MSPTCEIEAPAESHQYFVSPFSNAKIDPEAESRSAPETIFAKDGRWLFPGMVRVPENISDVIVKNLSAVDHVTAILMGRSGEVYHVWTMLDEWSAPARKEVYAAQRELLLKLRGFDLDFYVVPAEGDEKPTDLVSDIPVVWERAA